MRVFLDASVFIWAVERPSSNSSRIVKLGFSGRIEVVVDDAVLAEVSRFFRAHRDRSFAWLYTEQIRRVAKVLTHTDCEIELAKVMGVLKSNDRFHLAATRAAKARFLVAFDEDFSRFREYRTPRQAARHLGLRVSPTEW